MAVVVGRHAPLNPQLSNPLSVERMSRVEKFFVYRMPHSESQIRTRSGLSTGTGKLAVMQSW